MGAVGGAQGRVQHQPLHGLARRRAWPGLRRLRRPVAVVRRRPGGVLGVDLGLLRRRVRLAIRERPRRPRDARRPLVLGRDPELRRACPAEKGRRYRADRRIRVWCGVVGLVPRAAREGGGCGRGPAAAGRGEGRQRSRAHAEHPRDGDRVPGRIKPGGGLVYVLSGVRSDEHRRPLPPDRAEGPAGRGRVQVWRAGLPAARRRIGDPGRPPGAGADGGPSMALGRPRPGGPGFDDAVARAGVGAGRPDFRARAVRSPPLGALLVRDDGPAQADSPRARGHPARAPEGAVPAHRDR